MKVMLLQMTENCPRARKDALGEYLEFSPSSKLEWSGVASQSALINGIQATLTTANEIVYADLAIVDYKLRELIIE